MADIGTLLMKFEADDTKMNKAFDNVSTGVGKIGTAVTKMAKVVAVGMVAATAAITAVGVQAVKLAADQEKAEARLESIATTVTKATDDQIQSMKELAAAYQNVSTYGDEVIITGQSQLLSFGLTADQAEMLTGSMVDLLAANNGVTATSEDAINAANLLGKAFSGQAGALSRVGILLNDSQTEILNNGTAAEKTAALVEILNQNYGGLAQTLSETTEGQMQQVKNSLGDIGEVMGVMLLPILKDVLSWVQNNMPAIEVFMTNAWTKIVEVGTVLYNFFSDTLLPVFKSIYDFIIANYPAVKEKVIEVFNGILAVVTPVYNFWKENLLPIYIALYDWVIANMPAIKQMFEDAFNGIKAVAMVLWNFFKDNILPIFQSLVDWSQSNMPLVKESFTSVFEKIQELAKTVWDFYSTNMLPIFAKFFEWVQKYMPEIQLLFTTYFTMVVVVIMAVITALDLFFKALNFAFTVVNTVTSGISSAFKAMKSVVEPVITGINNAIAGLIDNVSKAADKIGGLGNAGSALKAVNPIGTGIIEGIGNIISGQKAYGGAVMAGNSYLVGERGTEVFTPTTNGTVSSGSNNIVINVNGANDPMATANQIVNILKMQGVA